VKTTRADAPAKPAKGKPAKPRSSDAGLSRSKGGGGSKNKAAGSVPTAETAGHHDDAHKGCVSRWHARITRKGDEFFYKLGHLVAHGPKMTLFIAFLCVFLCTFGFVNFRTESDCEKLKHETIALLYCRLREPAGWP